MVGQLLEPGGLDASDGAGEEAGGLDDFGGDQPAGRLVALALLISLVLFALVALEKPRAGKDHHRPVARRRVDIALFPAGYAGQQTGEHRAVDRVVVGGRAIEAEALDLA